MILILPVISVLGCLLIPIQVNGKHWENWLLNDPALPSPTRLENLSSLKAIYIDCGSYDQFHLQFGARLLHKALSKHKITHFFEEFPDNHTDIDYRYDISLPFLVNGLLDKKELQAAS